MSFQIKPVSEDCLDQALKLVRDVFMEFEAPEYSQQGIEEFMRYITPGSIREMLSSDALLIWVCMDPEDVRGVIAVRPPGHISLLFTDKRYHNQGIARSLFETVLSDLQIRNNNIVMTVNSSPNAVGFYQRMGFIETDAEQVFNGIRFIPMQRPVNK